MIDKPVPGCIKKKSEWTQINKIRNERQEETNDMTEIERMIIKYYKKPHAKTLYDLEEMVEFIKHIIFQS